MRILSKILALVILLLAIGLAAVIIQSKGPKDWSKESLTLWLNQILNRKSSADSSLESGHDKAITEENQDKLNNQRDALIPTPTIKPQKEQVRLYRWRDEKGKLQFSQTPPQDKPYKVVEYAVKQGTKPVARKSYPNAMKNPGLQPIAQKSQSNKQPAKQDPLNRLQTECRWDFKRLLSYEKKLAKEDSIKDSIWLQDYCEALSSLVTNNCNLSKKDIRFNRYCPLRYRR